jgi:cyclomaltodextrinase / maltogenic alpha-amylase / neopullulanase
MERVLYKKGVKALFKEAVFHRPKNNFVYAYNKETLHVRIQTKKDDINSITLHFQDPFAFDGIGVEHTTVDMTRIGTGNLYDYWQGEISSPDIKRIEYCFELTDGEETCFFGESGFCGAYEEIKNQFRYPYLHEVDVFNAPEWVKETVWYQIFPERYANGDTANDPEETLSWGSEAPSETNFFGGDLEGIIQKLDYIADLGVTGIYLTPIFKAESNHKYDTIDYMEIDPQFGDKETLKRLVKKAHNKGIRVMLDAVFNHSGFYFKPFQDVLENGEQSRYHDWFHIHEFPVITEPVPNYDTFGFTYTMPKFNTENPETREYLLKVARYWIEECDIDGWRLDVANEVDHAFWIDFRKTVKEVKADAYIVGEIWHDSLPWLQGDQFDAVMNYPFTSLVKDYFAYRSISLAEFREGIEELKFMYSQNVHDVAFNLLGSHDTPRILDECGDDKEKVKLLFLFQLAFSGSPCIYYGDEIAMFGGGDPGNRACMVWEEENQDLELQGFVKQLLQLRKEHKALSRGEIGFHVREDCLAFEKHYGDETLFIIINNSDEPGTFEFDHEHFSFLLLNGESMDEEKAISLPPKGYAILKA